MPAFGVNIPSVVTIHDLKYLLFPGFFKNSFKMMYYTWIIRRGARQAESIIAISASTKKDLISLGVPAGKITVIHESVTLPAELVHRNSTLPAAIGSRPYLFFVGDNRPHKNISRIIASYQAIMKRLGEASPSLVFAGAHFENLRARYANSALSRKLIFLGVVTEETLVNLYRGAIALVYPSLYEGFGLPILEAMSLGVPVITSDCSSLPEVAGNAAILVNPRDINQLIEAMISVIQCKSDRQVLKRRGIRRAQEFSWDKAARKTLDLYEDVLSKKPARLRNN
jgi:glycosyltransferase involved in cell wall biosynthesis